MSKRIEMLKIVKNYHAKQSRVEGFVPYWPHCLNVAEIVSEALTRNNELEDKNDLEDIYLAALGHDLYEDTVIEPKEIKKKFGTRVHDYINQLTDKNDDMQQTYRLNLTIAPEAVRLIKIADLIENVLTASFCYFAFPANWHRDKFFPIVIPMSDDIKKTKFKIYPKTSYQLLRILEFSLNRQKVFIDIKEKEGTTPLNHQLRSTSNP